MHKLRSIGGSIAIALALGAFIYLSNKSLGLTAVIALAGLTAATAFQGTLQNWVASGQIASEGFLHVGAVIVLAGPDGPFIGKIISRELRVTVIANELHDAQLVVPNAMLTAGAVKVLAGWPVPVPPVA